MSDVEILKGAGILKDGVEDLAQAFPPLLMDVWRQQQIPNASAAMGLPGDRNLYVGYANPDFDKDLTIDENTPFLIGSISKLFVAIAIMQLEEAGVLSIDDPLFDHFETRKRRPFYLPAQLRKLTIRDVLTHSAALAREGAIPGDTQSEGLKTLIDSLLVGGILPQGSPGDRIRYSNYGYQILAELVTQKVRRRNGDPDYTWDEYVRDHITDPLGMHDTGGTSGWTRWPTNLPPLYKPFNLYNGRQRLNAENIGSTTGEGRSFFVASAFPAASHMAGTTKDLVTLGRFFLQECPEAQVLRNATIQRMFDEVYRDNRGEEPKEYGLGVDIFPPIDGAFTAGHAGNMPGANSLLKIDLKNKNVYVQLGPGDIPDLSHTTMQMFADAGKLDHPVGSDEPIEHYQTRLEFNRAVAGLYEARYTGYTTLIHPVGDRLWAFWLGKFSPLNAQGFKSATELRVATAQLPGEPARVTHLLGGEDPYDYPDQDLEISAREFNCYGKLRRLGPWSFGFDAIRLPHEYHQAPGLHVVNTASTRR